MEKRIVHIIDSLGMGGAEQILRMPISFLKDYQHHIIILGDPVHRNDLPEDVPVTNLRFKGKWDLFTCAWRLKKVVNKVNPEIIHTHLVTSTIITRMAVRKTIPTVSTYHSLVYDRASKQYDSKLRWLDSITRKYSSMNIYVSEVVRKMYEDAVNTDVAGKVIHNFFHPKFTSKKESHSADRVRLVTIGNNRPEKDQTTIFEAFKQLSKGFHLTIIGHGFSPDDFLHDRVSIKETNAVHEELKQHDLFISSSRFEGFGISVVEAMATGLPCILSDIETYREVGQEEVIYFETGNAGELREKISRLSEDPEMMRQYSLFALNRSKEFSLESYLSNIKNVYQRLVN